LFDDSKSDSGAIQPQKGQAIRFDPLNPGANIIDLGSLTQEQQNALVMDYMRGTLDINKKAAQMHVDVTAFKNMLDVMATKTKELSSQENTSVTMSHTQETSVGKTEVIMGNTAQAASGRLTRTMAGERNLLPVYVTVAVIAVLILVALFLRH
jgi:hypothetical protein